jgi:hypothetical protein
LADIPRGLEGYSSRLHALRRQRHLRDNKHAVLFEQSRQKETVTDVDDELLAQRAASASRNARNFASLLGQADAWAVKDSLQPEKSGESVESLFMPFVDEEHSSVESLSDDGDRVEPCPKEKLPHCTSRPSEELCTKLEPESTT